MQDVASRYVPWMIQWRCELGVISRFVGRELAYRRAESNIFMWFWNTCCYGLLSIWIFSKVSKVSYYRISALFPFTIHEFSKYCGYGGSNMYLRRATCFLFMESLSRSFEDVGYKLIPKLTGSKGNGMGWICFCNYFSQTVSILATVN